MVYALDPLGKLKIDENFVERKVILSNDQSLIHNLKFAMAVRKVLMVNLYNLP